MILPEHCNHTLLEGNARAKLDQSPVSRRNLCCEWELSAYIKIARSINSVAAAAQNCCKTQQLAIHTGDNPAVAVRLGWRKKMDPGSARVHAFLQRRRIVECPRKDSNRVT